MADGAKRNTVGPPRGDPSKGRCQRRDWIPSGPSAQDEGGTEGQFD